MTVTELDMKLTNYTLFALFFIPAILCGQKLSLPESSSNFNSEKDRFNQSFELMAHSLIAGNWNVVLSFAMPKFKDRLIDQFGDLGPGIDYLEIKKLKGSTFSYNEEDGYFCLVIIEVRIEASPDYYYGISRWFLDEGKWKFDGLPMPKAGVSQKFQLPDSVKMQEPKGNGTAPEI